MKKLIFGVIGAAVLLVAPASTMAGYNIQTIRQESTKNSSVFGKIYNPVLAFYPNGSHGIPTQPGINHQGMDLVLKDFSYGGIKQIFVGYSEQEGLHKHVTKWSVAPKGTCPKKSTLIKNAYPDWGNYLLPGADYCVKEVAN